MDVGINVLTIKQKVLICFIFLISILNHIVILPKVTSIFTAILVSFFFVIDVKYKKFYKLLFAWFLMFIVGLIFSINHNTRDVVRDVFYFVNPLLFIIAGSFLAINFSFERFIRLIIFVGTFLSVSYVTMAVLRFGFLLFDYTVQIRSSVGVGNAITVIAASILFISPKIEQLDFISNLKFRKLLIAINVLAIILFSSRTYYAVLIIMVVIMLLPIYRRNIIKLFLSSVVILSIVFVLLNMFKGNFVVDKILQSTTEITITTDLDEENIYLNYRGYETKAALDDFEKSNTINKIFGSGFGKLIDLGLYVQLADSDWRYIPVLHNGFVYMLVKVGYVGCFLFFIFFISIMNLAKTVFKHSELLSVLLIGVLVSLCFTNYVISGIFNVELALLIIMFGALLQYAIELILFNKQ